MSTTSSRSQLDMLDDSMFASSDDLIRQSSQNQPATSPGKQQQDAFANQLTRLQEEQVLFMKRIDRERKRKEQLDDNMINIKQMLREIRDRTNNGTITKVNDINNRKLIARLEYQLQNANIKLSTARNDNSKFKTKVEDLRREKMLQLQILNDLHKETTAAKRRSKFCAREMQNVNEKKHKVKMMISNVKQKMIRDMEDFSKEIDKAKQAISTTQASILHTIREKLQMTQVDFMDDTGPAGVSPTTKSPTKSPPKSRGGLNSAGISQMRPFSQGLTMMSSSIAPNSTSIYHSSAVDAPATSSEVEVILRDTDFKSPYELLVALQQSEDSIFALYHETQSRHEEVEKMELENKYLEHQVQEQMKRLQVLEGNQEQVKLELEQNIQQLKTQMSKFDHDYAQNMDILQTIKDPMLSLLKNVAIDEEAMDQQLISTGITDRNILDYLAVIEQRIDELIQMVKAANHQPIRREDFMRMMAGGATMVTSTGPAGFAAPVPPSMDVGNEDEDDMLYNEENNKGFSVQPLNVGVLKEIIMKKLQQKATLPNPAGTSAQPVISQAHRRHGSYASSNHMSASSLHSNQSDRHG